MVKKSEASENVGKGAAGKISVSMWESSFLSFFGSAASFSSCLSVTKAC